MAKKYFAFISYKREDEDWAKWFQNELENYHLPSTLNGRKDINFEELPKQFRPVFRDIDELKAGNLPEQIYSALKDSLNLVVICSHLLADDDEAKWVNKEISDLDSSSKSKNTLFVIEQVYNCFNGNSPNEWRNILNLISSNPNE